MGDGKSGAKISRRDLLRVAGAGGAGLAFGAGGYAALRGASDARDDGDEAGGSSRRRSRSSGDTRRA